MSTPERLALLGIGFTLAACVNGSVLAQEATLSPEQSEIEAQMAGFERSQLEAFATAYVQIIDILLGADELLVAAETESERTAVDFEISRQMESVLESTEGLTIDAYNAIIEAAQTDPAFAQKLQIIVDAVDKQALD